MKDILPGIIKSVAAAQVQQALPRIVESSATAFVGQFQPIVARVAERVRELDIKVYDLESSSSRGPTSLSSPSSSAPRFGKCERRCYRKDCVFIRPEGCISEEDVETPRPVAAASTQPQRIAAVSKPSNHIMFEGRVIKVQM
ncbi:unnamed protein product [Prorocentrum cordatum]|uniref:Uncharacterized protein n=1 Tax=Prorocentrum cordatum TaxID=2364126 RepID=A0ABN9XL93_9DINO|nr:unnamed protein product [Polarella glacialis]